jgi:ribonuclease T1
MIGLLVVWFLWTTVPLGSPFERGLAHVVELAAAESQVSSAAISERGASESRKSIEGGAPQKAYELLAILQQRHGVPLPGYVGGRDFQNRERRLPRGRYREYDVNRKIPGRSRDAERLAIEQETGKAYYTGDHYRSFIPLN